MEISGKWEAVSNPQEKVMGEELVELAGTWGVGIDVEITKPFLHTQGSIKSSINMPNKENSLPANNWQE